ncbi:GNAT family N-acetyltransferase [Ensifer sp. T173]|uniref:GNAT family N-acetyltransferase n=1 Tax=Ensifer canadensis TaxID=555315 RepID=A0AAW4FUM6_9HYPH|nr:GNAT family N-acetyltransferase [Ensifer canadensis]MBM3095017.1 GNAT family N-acetyltransferase [Ensifer canadensis]UBI81115.1 GNAT family N-acetyltransferase [Ensifer canadensis]
MVVERVSIRRIAADEIDVFRSIRLEALRCEPASFASRFEDWQFLLDEEWRRRLNDPVFVAFSKCEPIGIMGLVRFRPHKMAHRATLLMVYLRECFRSTGLAKDLLDAVIDFARGEGVLQLELAVNAENPAALRFYRRHGFIEVGRIPCGLLDGDRGIEDVIMVRRLRG